MSSEEPDWYLELSLYQMIPTVIGTIGSAFIILTYILIEKIRNQYLYRALIHLAIMDFLYTAPQILLNTVSLNYEACYSLHMIPDFGVIGSFFWVVIMALMIHNIFFSNKPDYEASSNRWRYLACGYLGPVLCLVVRLFIEPPKYYADGVCIPYGLIDIDIETGKTSMPFFLIPFLSALTIELVIYVKIWLHIRRTLMEDEARIVLMQLIWYPLILIFCWGLSAVAYGIVCFQHSGLPVLEKIITIMTRSQGFLNAFVYGFSYNVRVILKEICIKPFCRANSYIFSDNSYLNGDL